jgi:hypothetical protein
MPGGPAFDSTQSYVAFAVVKFVGYSISAIYFNTRYPDARANPLLFGLTRTILGMLLGAVVGFLGLVALELAVFIFLLGLIPFRVFEWYLTLRLFFHKSENFKSSLASDIGVGIGCSFALDIPAIIGFVATGGFWIC